MIDFQSKISNHPKEAMVSMFFSTMVIIGIFLIIFPFLSVDLPGSPGMKGLIVGITGLILFTIFLYLSTKLNNVF